MLRVLNVAAVGFALSAITAAALAQVFGDRSVRFALAIAAPTWLLGTAWAALLRWPRTIGKTSFRVGWATSVPFAMANAGLAVAILTAGKGGGLGQAKAVEGFIVGALPGVIVWAPALLLTLLCFGAPIAWGQRLAGKGLAGEERGEWIVGLVCVAISAIGAALAFPFPPSKELPMVALTVALCGMLTGGAATAIALARELRRRRFVADAEAGKLPGFRVDPTEEGKVLVRVVAQGKGYRVADFEEEVFELDARGDALHPKALTASPGTAARSGA